MSIFAVLWYHAVHMCYYLAFISNVVLFLDQ